MNNVIRRLWSEQDGALISAEFMLVATILVIGVVVGLKAVRDAVVLELADAAEAFYHFSYSYDHAQHGDGWQYGRGGHGRCINVAAGHGRN